MYSAEQSPMGILLTECEWFGQRCRTPRLRTMREFAEAEIVIPDGPYKGLQFRAATQPFASFFLDAIDSGQWNCFFATGPTQSGKTLICFIVPLLYHLFEIGETAICGLPNMEIAADKWRENLLPAIKASRFADLLPRRGPGSRGGTIGEAIQFQNGATLRFMSGGGGDQTRSSFTARVIAMTEIDKMDQPGLMSREADKLTQLKARSDAFDDRRRIYGECTVSIEEGAIWQEYQKGTRSRIVAKCPSCGVWLTPERENLQGWQGAKSIEEARLAARFHCGGCGKPWTEDERFQMNRAARVLHRGQTIDSEDVVVGEAPLTDSYSFRWNAFNNLLKKTATIAAREWAAAQNIHEENAEKELRQFEWAIPYVPEISDMTPLEPGMIMKRRTMEPRGLCPEGTQYLTVGIDLGKYAGHWVLLAFREDLQISVVNYGVVEFLSETVGAERGVLAGLRDFRDRVLSVGFAGHDGVVRPPNAVWIDSAYLTDCVYIFCKESGPTYLPIKGHGASQDMGASKRYFRPKGTGAIVRGIGDGYHISRLRKERVRLGEIDVDQWKSWVHERLATVQTEPGAMFLFAGTQNDHRAFVKHLTAERRIQEFQAGKGLIYRWERKSSNNHWLDATTYACAAAHFCGWRLVSRASGGAGESAPMSLSEWFGQGRNDASAT